MQSICSFFISIKSTTSNFALNYCFKSVQKAPKHCFQVYVFLWYLLYSIYCYYHKRLYFLVFCQMWFTFHENPNPSGSFGYGHLEIYNKLSQVRISVEHPRPLLVTTQHYINSNHTKYNLHVPKNSRNLNALKTRILKKKTWNFCKLSATHFNKTWQIYSKLCCVALYVS